MTTADRPTLEGVLEHYGVNFSPGRMKSMVFCPMHETWGSTPSCSINLTKQVWNCHSCGKKGDAWTLIKEMEGVDFDGARAFAASQRLPAGDDGGSGGKVSRGRFGHRTGSSTRPRTDRRKRPYRPSWRRE